MIYLITDQKRTYETDIKLATIQDCLNYFKDKDIIEIDIETEHCKWNKDRMPDPFTSKVLCFQLGDIHNQFVFDGGFFNLFSIKSLMEDETKTKIFCNAEFDLRFFWHEGIHTKNISDIFLRECILTRGLNLPKGYKGLSSMANRYLGVEISKETRSQIHWRGLDEKVIRYAAKDVQHMESIRIEQQKELYERDLLEYVKLEERYVKDLSLMSYKGFKVNPDKWKECYKQTQQEVFEAYKELIEEVRKIDSSKIINTLFGEECTVDFNSSKQTQQFFHSIGINIFNTKGKRSVDIKHIRKQIDDFPILRPYIKYKELQKELSTYGINWLKKYFNPQTGRVHSQFFQILETGRISSSNPNIQNIPGEDYQGNTHKLRLCFTPDNGNVFIVADFSQLEPRITADYSGDEYLRNFIVEGSGDMHSLISTILSEYLIGEHINVSKENNPIVLRFNMPIRNVGKAINLGLDYGKSAFGLSHDLNISQDEAQKLLNIIADKTPKKTSYFERWINFVKKYGFVRTEDVFKSKTYFDNYREYIHTTDFSRKKQLEGDLERFARNNRIQGTAGLIVKLSQILFNDYIFENNLQDRVWIVNQIHDELITECEESIAEEVAEKKKEIMIQAGKIFCKDIPMKVEPEIGYLWKH